MSVASPFAADRAALRAKSSGSEPTTVGDWYRRISDAVAAIAASSGATPGRASAHAPQSGVQKNFAARPAARSAPSVDGAMPNELRYATWYLPHATPLRHASTCVEINQCVGCTR